MDEQQIKQNAQFLIENLPGMEIPGVVTFHCRHKHMVKFARCFGIDSPKYVGQEGSGIIACPAFANAFSAKIYLNMAQMRFKQENRLRGLVLDFRKLLHAGNEYDWKDYEEIRPGDELTIKGSIGKVWVNENLRLFGEINQVVTNQHGKLVCRVKSVASIGPGGY